MKKLIITTALSASLLMCVSCASHYQMTGIERTRILIDSKYDAHPDAEAARFMAPYKAKVDSIMSPVVGRSAAYLYAKRPEAPLSNLLADILVWSGKDYGEKPVFAVYNMGGIRAALAKGDITTGDVLDIAPFENKICFVTLKGEKVLQLFREIASTGGEALSHAVKLVITPDLKLVSAKINGEDIDPKASYRIATLDYVAQGNDKMEAFKSATNVNSPTDVSNNVRFIIMKYMKEQLKQGKELNPQVEGRITIKK